MTFAVKSSFDVAFWFLDTALNHNEYLQPQKLHRLLFLAQAYYGVAYKGAKLMPATFVVAKPGPIEPDLYRTFGKGRPHLDLELDLAETVQSFLDGVWRRLGHHSVEHLSRLCKESTAYRAADKRGEGSEIPFVDMVEAFTKPQQGPDVERLVPPRVLRTQSGKAVAVSSWMPAPAMTKRKSDG